MGVRTTDGIVRSSDQCDCRCFNAQQVLNTFYLYFIILFFTSCDLGGRGGPSEGSATVLRESS